MAPHGKSFQTSSSYPVNTVHSSVLILSPVKSTVQLFNDHSASNIWDVRSSAACLPLRSQLPRVEDGRSYYLFLARITESTSLSTNWMWRMGEHHSFLSTTMGDHEPLYLGVLPGLLPLQQDCACLPAEAVLLLPCFFCYCWAEERAACQTDWWPGLWDLNLLDGALIMV